MKSFKLYIWIFPLLYNLLEAAKNQSYEPNWDSLDSRPLPQWFDEAKVGIFLHWGVFSVPAFGSEWFWAYWKGNSPSYVTFMEENYPPGFTYQKFAPLFTAEFYNPDQWADIFEAAGARYIVLTSKHHEGYTMWPSKYSWNWNVMDVGPGRDVLGDLAAAVRKKNPQIHFGLYHSLYEWFNPLYEMDKQNNFTTNYFTSTKTVPELYELVNAYQPEVIWSDGDWEANDIYFGSTDFLAWLFNDSPVKHTVVVNDRWGIGIPCRHGSYYTCTDRYNPGILQPHKWENCMTLDKHSWGFRRNAILSDYLTIEELLKTMAETVSCGGNILINVGPTHDGLIPLIMEERLRQMGAWLLINGEAIYKSKPWVYQNDTYTPNVWFTKNGDPNPTVYAIVLNWPKSHSLILGSVKQAIEVYLLGYSKPLYSNKSRRGLRIEFPERSEVTSKWAWVLKLQEAKPKKK